MGHFFLCLSAEKKEPDDKAGVDRPKGYGAVRLWAESDATAEIPRRFAEPGACTLVEATLDFWKRGPIVGG